MPRPEQLLRLRLDRRRFLQGAAIASGTLLLPRYRRIAGALPAPPPDGFLGPAEYRVVEALTARIVSDDDGLPGARDCGVVDYIQGLLSAFPGADANRDDRISAADLTAIGLAVDSADDAADANADGAIDDADRTTQASALFHGALAGAPAFAGRPIFAGGPFSDRNPYPDPASGTPSDEFPANALLSAVPLTRIQRLAWTARLLGADAVPELADNPLARTLPDVDLRRRYAEGLTLVAAISAADHDGAPFDQLTSVQQDAVLTKLKSRRRSFHDLLVDHTVEGMLSAPEYGGNRGRVGWQLVGFDGDSQPLGYTIYDATIDDYRERPDKPNSTIDPDDPCADLSEPMLRFLRFVLVRLAGATEFPAPFCFDGSAERATRT
jgi:hypothetical protein